MQLSCTDNTVKHAVVALGSIGEHLMKDRSLTMKTLYQDKSLRFAHEQNTKAIQQLRRHLISGKDQSIELTLISCFLFIIFDFFFGDDVSSHAHLKAGINILKGCLPMDRCNTTLGTPSLRNAAISELIDLFTVMDLHAAIWLGLSSFQLPPLPINGNKILSTRPLSCFQSLEEACDSLSVQLMRTHVFNHSLVAYESNACTAGTSLNVPRFECHSRSSKRFHLYRKRQHVFVAEWHCSERYMLIAQIEVPFHLLARKAEFLFDLRTWLPALDALLETIPVTGETTRRVSLMKMVYLATFINLSTLLQPPEINKYHKYNSIFEQIVDLAKWLLRPASTENRDDLLRIITINNAETDSKNLPMFAFVAGAIQPLHMVAEKCCDTRLCLEAIGLLEERPWKEGAWDSTVMATIARRKLQERREGVC